MIVDRFVECGDEAARIIGMEAHHIVNAGDAAGEDRILGIERHRRVIALVGERTGHGGVTNTPNALGCQDAGIVRLMSLEGGGASMRAGRPIQYDASTGSA